MADVETLHLTITVRPAIEQLQREVERQKRLLARVKREAEKVNRGR